MKYFLLCLNMFLFTLSSPIFGADTSYKNIDLLYTGTFNDCIEIIVDPSQVSGSTDLLNFPMLVDITDPSLRNVSNGGSMENSNGYDIEFKSDCSTLLDFQIENYDESTGRLIAWVRIPVLSYSSATTIILEYGNAAISSDASTPNVWSSDHEAVWHLNNEFSDATGNIVDGINNGSTDTSGKIANGRHFDGNPDGIRYSTLLANGSTPLLKNTGEATLSAWINPDNVNADGHLISIGTGLSAPHGKSRAQLSIVNNRPEIGARAADTDWFYTARSTTAIGTGSWYYLTGTINYATSDLRVYINGVQQSIVNYANGILGDPTTLSQPTTDNTNNTNSGIGTDDDSAFYWVEGIIDEPRVINTIRSVDWILTEFNNQNSPSTFYSTSSCSICPLNTNNCGTQQYADSVISQTGVTDPSNALGSSDSSPALLYDQNDQLVVDLTDVLPTTVNYTIRWRRDPGTGNTPSVSVEESIDGSSWANATGSPFAPNNTSYFDQTITPSTDTRYIRLTTLNVYNVDLDAISYTIPCTEDNDDDGILDIGDADDDNDGIIDIDEYGCVDTYQFINSWRLDTSSNRRQGIIEDASIVSSVSDFIDGPNISITAPSSYMHINNAQTTSFAAAIGDGDYVEYGFTTQAGLSVNQLARMRYRKPPVAVQNFEYYFAVVISTDNFANSEVLIQDYYVDGAGIGGQPYVYFDHPGYFLESSTSYKVRIYFYDFQNPNVGHFDNFYLSVDKCTRPWDSDGDSVNNQFDLDNDDDGIPDNVEGQPTIGYVTPSGTINLSGQYAGLMDNYGTGLIPENTDGTDEPDYFDTDSDNDGLPDIQENGMANAISTSDTDNDGLDNTFEGSNTNDPLDVNDEINNPSSSILPDTDSDLPSGGDLDYRDDIDVFYPSATLDFDGVDDYAEVDSSIDGLSEYTVSLWFKYNGPTLGTSDDVFVMGQKDVFEISIRNWSTAYNPIHNGIMAKAFYNNSLFTGVSLGKKFNRSDWTNVCVTVRQNGGNVEAKVYKNGFSASTWGSLPGTLSTNSEPLRLGIVSGTNDFDYNFEGWMDEIRIFDTVLTSDQIQRMVYQEIENNAGNVHGSVIPKDIIDISTGTKVSWNNLIAYYPLSDIKNSNVSDYSNSNRPLKLYNITSVLEQTAPMPFETKADGDWTEESTWLHGDVWEIEYLPDYEITSQSPEPWSIVHIKDSVTTSSSHKGIGMFIDTGKTLRVNNDNEINNSWYVALNGTLDLQDDSQLIQTANSDLVTSAEGKLLRCQEGASSVYWYNYWASPVGSLGATSLTDNNTTTNNTNNSVFNLGMLKKDVDTNFQFTGALNEVGKISVYWLYTYKNGVTYNDWGSMDANTVLEPGVGYTQKGTGVGTEQQYLFEGKPNNGTIVIPVTDTGGSGSVPAVSKTDYLLGNPYASAIDLHEFIDDNAGVIDGAIQLWQQWSGSSHILDEYNGGYAQVNKTGSTRAYQFVGIEGGTNGNQDGVKVPSRYLSVGQGFMTEIVNGGNIVFRNSQRVFIKESDANGDYDIGSVFFRNGSSSNTNDETTEDTTSDDQVMQKLRIEFNSVDGPFTRRELLLGFSDYTTDDYDYGYDAINVEVYADDLNLVLADDLLTIQAYSEITADKVVPLMLKASGPYNYTIELTETENIPEDQELYLLDNLTNSYYDLRSEQAYEFSSEVGEYADRFEIAFQEPSDLLSLVDEAISSLKFYYASSRKKIVVLNPYNVDIESVEVYNVLGQLVYRNNTIHQSKFNEFEVHNLSTGTYIIKLITDNNVMLSKKMIMN